MLRDLIRRQDTPVSQLNNPNVPLYQALTGLLDGPASDAGVTVSTTSAMRLTAVYACVRLIAETIAAMPLKTYTGDGPDRREARLPAERVIWDRPNPEQTRQTFWSQVLVSLLLDGNAFVNTARDGLGRVAELWVLDPTLVSIGRTEAGERVYEVSGSGTLTPREIVHIPGILLPGAVRGLSPIGQARQALGIAIAAEKLGARLFGSGTLLGGILEVDADLSGKEHVVQALQERFASMNAGLANSHRVAVIDNGAKFRPLGLPPEDAQFLESRRFQVAEIARLYGVPPHMIGDVERSTSWGTGIEQQNIGFVQYTLQPWIIRIEQAITAYLLPRPRYAKFTVDGLLRGDVATRIAYYGAGRRDGWLTPNQIRALEDMPPREDPAGDQYLDTPTGAAPNRAPEQ